VAGPSHERGLGPSTEVTVSGCLDENQAIAFAVGQRGSALGDPVARHVDACVRCQALVAAAARARLSGEPAADRPPEARTLDIGELCLGRYQIVRFIGAGGMGEVYEALDRELGDPVALKTVALTTLDDERSVARLKAEVQLARRITHPNVCRMFDFGLHTRARPGLDQEPLPLLTMELLAGETLASHLRGRGPLGARAARPILEQILSGLAAVHRANIIHRDLKAENVFLVPKPGTDQLRAVLMDFGLARPALPGGGVLASVRHALVGTASYMAPEQVEGRPVSFASDVYAVGVLMFEMVTGRLPFVGNSTMEIAVQRLKGPAPRPSSLVADVDPVWEQAILKCLERAPADRFQSVDEIARALSSSGVLSRLLRRSSVVKTIAGTALAVFLGAYLWLTHKAPPVSTPSPLGQSDETQLADWRREEDAHTAAIERDPAQAASHLVSRSIVREDRCEFSFRRGRNAFADSAAAEADLTRALEIDPSFRSAYYRRGRIRVQRAINKLKYGLDPTQDLDAAEPDLRHNVDIRSATSWLGHLQFLRGVWKSDRGENGRPDFEASVATLGPLQDAYSLMRLGHSLAYLGRFAESERAFAESVRLLPANVWAHIKWGMARALAGDLAGAEAHLTRAIEIDATYPNAWEERANARLARRAYAEAAADYQQAIAINSALEPLVGPRLREARARASR
jgi:serine/threonine protein kinase